MQSGQVETYSLNVISLSLVFGKHVRPSVSIGVFASVPVIVAQVARKEKVLVFCFQDF